MKPRKSTKQYYLEIYQKAHNNAVELLQEAEILFKHKKYSRAYFLAFTTLEEISKSQFAADVFTGMCSEEEFKAFYRNHKVKIRQMGWAHNDANSYPHNLKWVGPDQDDMEEVNPKAPIFQKRQASLYVDIDFERQIVSSPGQVISEEDAREIIHIVGVALQRVLEVTEFWGHQIGTKGFMK